MKKIKSMKEWYVFEFNLSPSHKIKGNSKLKILKFLDDWGALS